MKRVRLYVAILFFVFVTSLFFYQVILQAKIPIAADAIVGLYHPFRDFYLTEYPNGIPFKNFLITDPVRQQYPWRFLAIDEVKNLRLPIWNPYNGTGMPLMANFQTGAFYPLNSIFFIFPFLTSWNVLVVLQVFLSGLFMYLYLRFLRLHFWACILGGLSFSLSGFAIAWLEWNTILQTVMWVPLLLLAKDHYLKGREKKWLIILVISECSLLLAGHLQTAFYCLVIVNLYLFARIFEIVRSESPKQYVAHAFRLLRPFIIVGAVVAILTSIQWFPTILYLPQTARSVDQANWLSEGWFIPWQNLIQFIAPDFFGNPATLNYWGVWNYGEMVGYVGIVPIIMALFALVFRRDKKTVFFGTLFFISLIFSLPTFLAKLPYLLNIPYLSSSQPTRLLIVVDFSLAILAALGFDMVIKRKRGILYPLFFLAICFAALWGVVFVFFGFFGMTFDQTLIAKNNLKLPTILFAAALFLISLTIIFRQKKLHETVIVLLVALSIFDLVRFGWKFTPFTKSEYLYPSTKAISFLQKDRSLFRVMTTDSRLFPPNFSMMYQLQSLDLYDPLYLRRYGELIAAIERGEPNIQPPFGFNRIITPHAVSSPLLNLLNVKYVLSFSDLTSTRYRRVYAEGGTSVFENTEYLPRAFFVKKIITARNPQDAIEKLFSSADTLGSVAVVEGSIPTNSFSPGTVSVVSYKPNEVVLKTKNDGEGFLVFSDAFFPSWKAAITTLNPGNSRLSIYRTNFAFRGVILPPGEHTVVFSPDIL